MSPDDAVKGSEYAEMHDPVCTSLHDDADDPPDSLPANGATRAQAKFYRSRFYRPPVVLALFTFISFMTFYDRGAMGASIPNIRGDPDIAGEGQEMSETTAGVLSSVFMGGYFLTCPLFVALGGRFSAKALIIFGTLLWSVGCVLCGLSGSLAMLMCARALVGVGEAAYAGFCMTIIDNMAPPHLRTRWIGIYLGMIPVGTAVGMGVTGVVMSADTSWAPWRTTFIFEVVPMLTVAALLSRLPAEYNPVKPDVAAGKLDSAEADLQQAIAGDVTVEGSDDSGDDVDDHVGLRAAIPTLMKNPNFLLIVCGNSMNTFGTGAIAVWIITMMVEGPLEMSALSASLLFGGTVAVCGIAGAVFGGFVVDRLGGSHGAVGVRRCCLITAGCVLTCVPCGLIALGLQASFGVFLPFFVVSCFFLFAINAPSFAALLSSVPSNLRTYAVTFNIFFIHLLGDVPSPVIAGALADSQDKGCIDQHSSAACSALAAARDCRWIPAHRHTAAFCTNEYQMVKALCFVYLIVALGVPCYLAVAWRKHREMALQRRHAHSEHEAM
jgi:MFS family permease